MENQIKTHGLIINVREGNLGKFDNNVINEVIVGDTYKLKQLKESGYEPEVIVDIGGHIGTFGVSVKQLWPEAVLVAIEPSRTNWELYNKNLIDNGLEQNTVVIHAALAYGKETVSLFEDLEHATGGGHIREEGNSYPETYTNINALTLEDMLRAAKIKKVDLLKMDCEGAEHDLVENANEETLKGVTCLLGEYHIYAGKNLEEFKNIIAIKFPNLEVTTNGTSGIGNFTSVK